MRPASAVEGLKPPSRRDVSADAVLGTSVSYGKERTAALVTAAVLRERSRISRGLHDDVGQLLGVVHLYLGELAEEKDPVRVARKVHESRALLSQVIRQIRALTFDLQDASGGEDGLEDSLRRLAEAASQRYRVPFDFERTGSLPAIDTTLRELLCSIARELMWNVAKHARADRGRLCVSSESGVLTLAVIDDGLGFEPSHAECRGPDRPQAGHCTGLQGARRRLAHLGGRLEVRSTPGIGSRVTLTIDVSDDRRHAVSEEAEGGSEARPHE